MPPAPVTERDDGVCSSPSGSPPYIQKSSDHYRYAALVVMGYPYAEALRMLAIGGTVITPRQAKRWRIELMSVAAQHFGRPVTYEFAARKAIEGSERTPNSPFAVANNIPLPSNDSRKSA